MKRDDWRGDAYSFASLPRLLFNADYNPPRSQEMKPADATTPRILIADDQPDVLQALRLLFKGEGYRTETVSSPAAVLESLNR